MAGMGYDGPRVQAGLNLATDSFQFIISQCQDSHHSLEVVLHGLDSGFPEPPKVRGSLRDSSQLMCSVSRYW